MAVRIDDARHQSSAFAVELVVELFGALVAALEQGLHLAVVVDDQPGKVDHLALGVERHAVDVFDQPIGERRSRGAGEQCGGEREDARKGPGDHLRGSLRTSALVS